ncbi:MAG: hypothetical protein GTO14_23070, partial [Anaerolineales bacterium]|nr:hypothetical protein [Anaerolineales bacterium]
IWDTTGFAFGHYDIRAEASVVTNETETDDNMLKFGDIVILGVHDIAVTDITASPRDTGPGDLISINVTVVNQGDFAENFSVTAKCGYFEPWDPDIPAEYLIDTKAVASMPSETSRILTFTLDTSEVALNPNSESVSLWIEANASVVPYETEQANNKHKMDGDVTLWTEHAPFEHELTVSLEVPAFLDPDQTSVLNATVHNGGLNNETSVDLFLLINGTAVSSATIPELPIGASHTINYSWTPLVEATFNVTAYAPPVPDEDVTANNVATEMVIVRPLRYILFDQTHGTDMMTHYSVWVANLTSMGYVVESLTLSPITPSLLEGYDVFVIPEALDYYSSDELSAIQDFVLKGGGLLVIGDDNPPIYTGLTGFAGIDWMSRGYGDFISHDITPHEVTEGINSVFLASPFAKMSVTAPALGLVRD